MSRRWCRLAARSTDHQRPTDGQTLTAAVMRTRRQDRSITITRTRHRTPQLHAGQTQSYLRPLTTIRMTALWTSKEAHPRATGRRTLIEATSSATRRDRSSIIARTQLQDNEETLSAGESAQLAETATPTYLGHQPHDSTVRDQVDERRIHAHEPSQ